MDNPSRFLSPMSETILVNFHCHSLFSDGDQTPEVLAADLAANGVRYAALTDHDSIEGYQRFQEALKKRGVTGFPGLELTTQFHGKEIHLLCYGFDPHHPDLIATLISMRQSRSLDVHSIADSIRKLGNTTSNGEMDQPVLNAAPSGTLQAKDAIDLIHSAGGKVFLAHPFFYETEMGSLDGYLAELKTIGLDGSGSNLCPIFIRKKGKIKATCSKV